MVKPIESKLNTVTVPALGADPATIYVAADRPLRVIVRNVSGVVVFIAHDTNSLQQAPPVLAGTFQLPPGQSEVFILQPRQGMWAGAAGAGALVSIGVSEALPIFSAEA